jgi:hypothetical protein
MISDSSFWRAVQSLPLWARLALAIVSAGAYWVIGTLGARFDWDETIFGDVAWQSHLIAAIFGALVMAPCIIASRLRWPRVAAMCVASALIYFYAVKFVIDGPLSYNTITPFLISGGGAALLVGLSVVALAPQRASARLLLLCLLAGVIGGATFDDSIWLDSGFAEIGGHFAWQVLVCLALHFGCDGLQIGRRTRHAVRRRAEAGPLSLPPGRFNAAGGSPDPPVSVK